MYCCIAPRHCLRAVCYRRTKITFDHQQSPHTRDTWWEVTSQNKTLEQSAIRDKESCEPQRVMREHVKRGVSDGDGVTAHVSIMTPGDWQSGLGTWQHQRGPHQPIRGQMVTQVTNQSSARSQVPSYDKWPDWRVDGWPVPGIGHIMSHESPEIRRDTDTQMKRNASLYNWYRHWTMAGTGWNTLQAVVWRQDNSYNSYMDGYKGIIVYMCRIAAIKYWHTLAPVTWCIVTIYSRIAVDIWS